MRKMLAAATLSLLLLSPAAAEGASANVDPVFPRGLAHAPSSTECWTYRCVWDGKHQGDKKGPSLILTRYGKRYIAKRITHRRAHRLQAAYCARKSVTCARGY